MIKATRGVARKQGNLSPVFIFWDADYPEDKRIVPDSAECAFVVTFGVKLDKARIFNTIPVLEEGLSLLFNPDSAVVDIEDDGTKRG